MWRSPGEVDKPLVGCCPWGWWERQGLASETLAPPSRSNLRPWLPHVCEQSWLFSGAMCHIQGWGGWQAAVSRQCENRAQSSQMDSGQREQCCGGPGLAVPSHEATGQARAPAEAPLTTNPLTSPHNPTPLPGPESGQASGLRACRLCHQL